MCIMAVALSPALTAAQAAPSRTPAISFIARASAFAFPRLHWRRLWQDNNPHAPHAATVAADGSLIRARNVSGQIAIQRIPDPSAPNAPWASWATGFASTASGRGLALASHHPTGEVLLLYTRSNTVYFRRSTDNGASWGAETAILTEASEPLWPALAFRLSTGNVCAFWALGATAADVRRTRRTSGSWAPSSTSAGTTLSNTIHTVTGIAAVHDGADFALLITGTEDTTLHRRTWATRMGDGGLPANAWATPVNVAEADAASTLTFHTPSLLHLPGSGFYATFAARETGNVATERTWWTHTMAGNSPSATWLEPAPHADLGSHGLALALAPDTLTAYASSARRVFRAGAIGATADLSSRLLAASVRFSPEAESATFDLDDADGQLAAAIGADPPPPLAPGHDLVISPGYTVAGSPAYGVTWTLHIDAIATTFARDGKRLLRISASGPWAQLARWHAPQARQFPASTLTRGQIVSFIAGRAGVPVTEQPAPFGASPTWTAYDPSFVLIAGESGAAALRRLLAPLADVAAPDAPNGGLLVRSWEDPRWEALIARLRPAFWHRLREPAGALAAQDETAGQFLASFAGSPAFGAEGPLVLQPTSALAVAGSDALHDNGASAWLTANTNWTLLALARPTSWPASGFAAILCNGPDPAGDGFAIAINTSGQLIYHALNAGAVALGPVAPAGAWSFLALTRDSSTVRAYVDAVAGATSALAPNPSASRLSIGARWTGSAFADFFNGHIAETALFTRPLTETELSRLQQARNPAQWTFGPGGHPAIAVRLGTQSPPVNWARVVDADGTRYADAFAPPAVYAAGPRRHQLRVADAHQDQRALDYAAGALARAATEDDDADLVAPWHAGLQLGDILRVNASAPDGAPAPSLRRITSLELRFERGARYEARLNLGAL